jgi:hypothetical protein
MDGQQRSQTVVALHREPEVSHAGLSRRWLLRAAAFGGAGLAAIAGGTALASAGTKAGVRATAHHPAAPAPAARPAEVWLYLSILTGAMIGRKGWPEYVPADFTVPADSLVHVEIRCFDNGTASVPSGYEYVHGTVGGTMQLIRGVNGNVDALPVVTVNHVAPGNVAHTLTFSDLNLSVPVPPLSTVRFAVHTPGRGTYGWQCMAACGTGQGGWGGPMATQGYMNGFMHVV